MMGHWIAALAALARNDEPLDCFARRARAQ
jgi:hypothetical protein